MCIERMQSLDEVSATLCSAAQFAQSTLLLCIEDSKENATMWCWCNTRPLPDSIQGRTYEDLQRFCVLDGVQQGCKAVVGHDLGPVFSQSRTPYTPTTISRYLNMRTYTKSSLELVSVSMPLLSVLQSLPYLRYCTKFSVEPYTEVLDVMAAAW